MLMTPSRMLLRAIATQLLLSLNQRILSAAAAVAYLQDVT